jgi:hypothetical protein
MRFKALTIIHVICPLLLGGVIYISFRSLSLRMFDWFEVAGLKTMASFIRSVAHPLKNHLPSWIYFSLPDGLWVYSFTSSLILLWNDQFEKGKYWLIIPFTTGCLFELAQGLKLVKGTFDPIDFALCLLFFCLSLVILRPKIQKNEKRKNVFEIN